MSTAVTLNTIGLLLDMVGAVFLFKYGLPPDLSRTGATFLRLEQDDESEKAKAQQYDQLGYIGIVLMFIGFALQLVSNYL